MADVISHTEQVKAAVQGVSAWMPVISALGGGVLAGGVALLVTRLNHSYAREREVMATAERVRHEQQLAEDKRQKELFYITTELVFMLERYAEACARVATDDGKDDDAPQPEREAVMDYPELNLADVSGDWRALQFLHMYRIRELPVLQNEAYRAISYAAEIPAPPLHEDYFRERQYQFTRLGIKAVILAVRLRRATGLPETRLTDHDEWSVVSVFRKVWKRERPLRAAEAARNREWNQPVITRHYDGGPTP